MRAKLAGALATVVALGAPFAPAPARSEERTPASITDIRQEAGDRSTRLVVACTAPIAYTYYSPDPLTLVVDVPEVDSSKVASRISVGTPEVESIRITNMARGDGRNLARIEVKLASLVPYQIFSKGHDLNLVFERSAAAAAAAPAPAPVVEARHEAPVVEAAPVAPAPAPEIVAVPETPVVEARAVAPAPAGPRRPASRILSVVQTEEAGQLAVTVRADGSLRYQDFFLGNPDRLVVDFKDVTSRANVRSLDVNKGPVRKVRLAQFSAASPRVARMVLDLSARAPYRIVDGADGVKILFGEGAVPTAAPLAALRPEADAAAAMPEASMPVQILPGPAPAPLPVLPDPQAAPPAPERPAEFQPSHRQQIARMVRLRNGDLIGVEVRQHRRGDRREQH